MDVQINQNKHIFILFGRPVAKGYPRWATKLHKLWKGGEACHGLVAAGTFRGELC